MARPSKNASSGVATETKTGVLEASDITLGKDVNFKEFDETAAADVELTTCPKCGHSFPK